MCNIMYTILPNLKPGIDDEVIYNPCVDAPAGGDLPDGIRGLVVNSCISDSYFIGQQYLFLFKRHEWEFVEETHDWRAKFIMGLYYNEHERG